MLFEHEADRPSVQHHPRDPASVNAVKQTCVIVILAYFTLFQPNSHRKSCWNIKLSIVILKHLNKHAPIKTKRVKTKRMPIWFTQDIVQMQNARDNSKRLKQWTEYRIYRNKTKQLIRAAKRKYFTESVSNSKDTKHIWAHLRTVNGDTKASSKHLPQVLTIDDKKIYKIWRHSP